MGVLCVLGIVSAATARDYLPSDELDAVGFKKFWQVHLPLEPGQEVATAFLLDDQLYIGTRDGYVYAIYGPTGTVRWMRKVTATGYLLKTPTHVADWVLFPTTNEVVAYDRVYGDGVFRHSVDFGMTTGVAADSERFYVGSDQGFIYAFDLVERFRAWRARTGSRPVGEVVVSEGTVFTTVEDGRLYAIRAEDKVARWRSWPKLLRGAAVGPRVTDDAIYVPGLGRSLYKFARDDGEQIWRARLSTALYEPVEVRGETAYVYTDGDGLVAIRTGAQRVDELIKWKVKDAHFFLTQDEKRVFALSRQQHLLVVDRETGAIIKRIFADGFTRGLAADDQTIYLVSDDGRLFCARPKDVPLPDPAAIARALRSQARETEEAPAQPDAGAAEAQAATEAERADPPTGGKSRATREYLEQLED
jgi:outer membrane protein assembly factor BamB